MLPDTFTPVACLVAVITEDEYVFCGYYIIVYLWFCLCVCVCVYSTTALIYKADNRNISGNGRNAKFDSGNDFKLSYCDDQTKHTLSNTTILTYDRMIVLDVNLLRLKSKRKYPVSHHLL